MCKEENMNSANVSDSLDSEKVSIDTLSKMTGFPVEFIKKELLIENEEVSMNELRSTMMTFLDSTIPNEQVQ